MDIKEAIKKEAVIYFYAQWCGPCKMFAPTFEKVKQEFSAIFFAKIDVDVEEELVHEYNIQAMPTIICFKNGKEVERCVGVPRDFAALVKESFKG